MKRPNFFIFCVPALFLFALAASGQERGGAAPATNVRDYVVPAGTILRLTMSAAITPGHLKPGSQVDGELSRPVYLYDREVIPAGSHVHAIVGNVDKHRVQGKGFIEHLQTVRSLGMNRKFDYDVAFQSAELTPVGGRALPLQLKFVDAGEVLELHTKGDQVQVGGTTAGDYARMAPGVGKVESIKREKKQLKQYRHPEVSLEIEQPLTVQLPPDPAEPLAGPVDVTAIPSGTHARLLLLDGLSASENKQGDIFHARVLEPIVHEGHLLLPEGATLEGHIGKVVPPRRLSRPGSLFLVFDKVVLPNGNAEKVSASLVGTELDPKAAGSMDEEGGLHGKGRGAKQTMKDFGVGLFSQQVADEVVELATHAVAPYVSIPMGLAMFMGGHGHDVSLPRFSELEIVMGRPMPIGHGQPDPGAVKGIKE